MTEVDTLLAEIKSPIPISTKITISDFVPITMALKRKEDLLDLSIIDNAVDGLERESIVWREKFLL